MLRITAKECHEFACVADIFSAPYGAHRLAAPASRNVAPDHRRFPLWNILYLYKSILLKKDVKSGKFSKKSHWRDSPTGKLIIGIFVSFLRPARRSWAGPIVEKQADERIIEAGRSEQKTRGKRRNPHPTIQGRYGWIGG
jgi:hypothetical protein